MTTKSSKKYGIILIVVFSLFILGALALSDSSKGFVKITNDTDEPINITISSLTVGCTHDDLNNYSDTILIGTVEEILPSKWNTLDGKKPTETNVKVDQRSFIYTDIVVKVDKYLKTSSPSEPKEIIVRIVGGTVGADRVTSEDEPSFKPGEKVLLYLTKDTISVDSEHYLVTGSQQGKFTLTDDGKATRPDENTTLEELLSTIKDSNNTVEQPNHPEVTSTNEPVNSNSVEEPITGSISGSLVAFNYMELIKRSDTIVIGTVTEILPSKWNSVDGKRADGDVKFSIHNTIYTDILISVDEYVKNPLPSKEIRVRVEGGTVGNDTLFVECEPKFQPEERVLLYLMKDDNPCTKDTGPEHFIVTGALQGKFTLINGKLQDPLRILPPWMSW